MKSSSKRQNLNDEEDSIRFGMGKRGGRAVQGVKQNRDIRQGSNQSYSNATMLIFKSKTKTGKLLIADL